MHVYLMQQVCNSLMSNKNVWKTCGSVWFQSSGMFSQSWPFWPARQKWQIPAGSVFLLPGFAFGSAPLGPRRYDRSNPPHSTCAERGRMVYVYVCVSAWKRVWKKAHIYMLQKTWNKILQEKFRHKSSHRFKLRGKTSHPCAQELSGTPG